MKLKLMISALMLCSSLSLAEGDSTTAPPSKKPIKVLLSPTSLGTSRGEGTAVGGLGTMGTSSSTAMPRAKKVRAATTTTPAPEK